MREIIQIQAGQGGNQIGTKFWEAITNEHGIELNCGTYHGAYDLQELDKINVFFNETIYGRYVPRSIFVDLEPGSMDYIRGSSVGLILNQDNLISGKSSASNNFAKGYYGEGKEISNLILDIIRKETEACDCLQGFQFNHSLGGGTGSGLGSLLINQLRDEYPDRIIASYPIIPSVKVSDCIVEPYNAVLSFRHLIDSTQAVFCVDNESLYDICFKTLELTTPTYGDLNHLVAMAMAGTTSTLRFPLQHNSDLRKLAVNLAPFPRLHFFTIGFAPLKSRRSNTNSLSVTKLIDQASDTKNMLASCDPHRGVYLTASVHFRGRHANRTVDEQIANLKCRYSSYFVDWIPSNFKYSMYDLQPYGSMMAATFIGNTTAFREVFQRIYSQFNKMYSKKSYLHYYVNEGLEANEFNEAQSKMKDIIQEYERLEIASSYKQNSHEEDEIDN